MRFLFLALVLTFATQTLRAEPPGDYDPEMKRICSCSCTAIGMGKWYGIVTWNEATKSWVKSYVWGGVSLFRYIDQGQIYDFHVDISETMSCGRINGAYCSGNYQEKYDSPVQLLNGRYSNCFSKWVTKN